VCPKSSFEKTTERYTVLSGKSMLSKCKNIAKTMEGHLKSHISHIHNEVEKTTPILFILERFLEPKSSQVREKIFRNQL